MDTMIFNPLEDYEKKFQSLHFEITEQFFSELVKKSGVDIEENRKTVKEYDECRISLEKLKKKRTLFLVLRVFMFITLILIPVVFWKLNPKIKKLSEEVDSVDNKAAELLRSAQNQMLPLNSLFTTRDAIDIIEKTIPSLKFDRLFSLERETDMRVNYDFNPEGEGLSSTLDVLSGEYKDNPFLFEKKLVHTMGTETYHGYRTISWTESYTDSNGKRRTRTRTQTLHATVVKPKPFYSTQIALNYGAQGAPDLTFSRDASHLEQKSEREIERIVKKGEKKLKRKTDRAVRENDDFVSMSNTDFEVLFDALDRDDEVQFRTLFTPLAQTNMVDLILSKTGFGDDFNFFKSRRMNKIVSNHSQRRALCLDASEYTSYSYDIICENFKTKNENYFKAVYFDFAPIWAIPMYQERPVHSLKPIPDTSRLYSAKESECLANRIEKSLVVHVNTKTEAILKTDYLKSTGNSDEISVMASSYDIIPRVDVVSVFGGDGRYHNVSVPWDEYIPLENTESFYVTKQSLDGREGALATNNGLCIKNKL